MTQNPTPPKPLTPKQHAFVQGLVVGKTRREAYRSAYRAENMNDASVDAEAYRLFHLPHVQNQYQQLHTRLVQQAEEEAIASGKQVLQELARVAFASAADYARVEEKDGQLRLAPVPTGQLAPGQLAALAGYKQASNGSIEVKTHCKMRALELLGRHFGLFAPAQSQEEAGGDEAFTVEIHVVEGDGQEAE